MYFVLNIREKKEEVYFGWNHIYIYLRVNLMEQVYFWVSLLGRRMRNSY